jgi:hypothetical protein
VTLLDLDGVDALSHLFRQVKQIATAELTEIELIIDRTIDTCLEKARIKPGVSQDLDSLRQSYSNLEQEMTQILQLKILPSLAKDMPSLRLKLSLVPSVGFFIIAQKQYCPLDFESKASELGWVFCFEQEPSLLYF